MGDKIKNLLLYAGLDQTKNEEYKSFILKQDAKNLTYFLEISGALFLLLGIASIGSSGFAHRNARIYLLAAVSFGIIWLLQKLTLIRRGYTSGLHRIYIYLFMMTLYSEAITITIMHKDEPAVTYIGVLLIIPLLFAQYPLPMFFFQGTFVALFCIASSYFKNPETAAIDRWNGLSFLLVSIVEIILVVPMRFNQIIQPEIIRKLSEKDLLTGLKNRNTFEAFCNDIRSRKTNIICIYADINGLHEMNNDLGHGAGDEMLKTVAKVMIRFFGNDNVYRIGGDEFVAFISDVPADQVEHLIIEAKKELTEKGYYLSMGYSGTENSSESIDEIIKTAEVNMYADKRLYYCNTERDRRCR